VCLAILKRIGKKLLSSFFICKENHSKALVWYQKEVQATGTCLSLSDKKREIFFEKRSGKLKIGKKDIYREPKW
jgi:hypothetical protein